jgi:MFS family permease
MFVFAALLIIVGFVEAMLLPPLKMKRAERRKRPKSYSIFVLGFAFGALLALTPISLVYLNEQYKISPLEIAMLLLILDVITMFMMYLSSHLTDRLGFKKSLMVIAIPCITVAFMLPFISPLWIFVILFFVLRMSISSFLPISRSYATSMDTKIGSNIGTLNMVTNFGAVVGPIIGGFIYDMMSGTFKIAGYAVVALFLLPTFLVQMRKR